MLAKGRNSETIVRLRRCRRYLKTPVLGSAPFAAQRLPDRQI